MIILADVLVFKTIIHILWYSFKPKTKIMYLNDQDFANSKSIHDDNHNKTLDHTTFYDDRGRTWKALSKGFSPKGLMCLVAPSGAIVYKTRKEINDGKFTARHN